MKRHPERYGKTRSFEDVWLWQQAPFPVRSIYDDLLTQKDFGFRDQIQRASISIMNNIAEGYERQTDKEFLRFLYVARSSCAEVRSMLYLADEFNYATRECIGQMHDTATEIAKLLSGLIKYLKDYPARVK